jgi:hypothetical protein
MHILSKAYFFPGLAEAGLIESKLSRRDVELSADEDNSPFFFSPERYDVSVSNEDKILAFIIFFCT